MGSSVAPARVVIAKRRRRRRSEYQGDSRAAPVDIESSGAYRCNRMNTKKVVISHILAICGLIGAPARVNSQPLYQGLGTRHCIFSQSQLPVYFQSSSLSGTGYDATLARESLMHTINVWNEESQSRTLLYYAGDGYPPPGTQYSISVLFDNTTDHCAFHSSAAAYAEGSDGGGGVCGGPSQITVFLKTCGVPTQNRVFSLFHPDATSFSLEAVLLHEFGHAAFGFADYNYFADVGLMFGTVDPGPAYNRLHLYPIEQNSASASPTRMQTTNWRIESAVFSSSTAWEGGTSFPLGGASPLSVTVGPTLHRDASYSGLMFGASSDPLHALFTQSRAESSAWASSGLQPPASGVGGSRLWVRVAVSDYNEVMVIVGVHREREYGAMDHRRFRRIGQLCANRVGV